MTNGSLTVRRAPRGNGVRITYTNGGTLTTTFFLRADLRVASTNPQSTLKSVISGSSQAIMGRNAIFGENDGGSFDLVKRGDLGGLRVAINEVEVVIPIKGDNAVDGATGTVDSAGAKILDDAAIPSGTTSVQIQASGANNQRIFIGVSSGTVGEVSAYAEIDAGQAIYISLVDGMVGEIWAAANSGTQRYRLFFTKGGGA